MDFVSADSVNGTVRPEPVEGQSRTFPNEASAFAIRCDKALHFDKLSANGSSDAIAVRKVTN